MECSKREMYRDMARATKWDELRSGGHSGRRLL